MSGAIMPAPLAMPFSTTSPPPIRTRRVAAFGNVSVVMMARAASRNRPGAASAASRPRCVAKGAGSSGSPMTPVEARNTSSTRQPTAAAAASALARTASRPFMPVKALALPELTTSARARPPARRSRSHSTGADAQREVVNTPATTAAGSKRIRSRSVRLRVADAGLRRRQPDTRERRHVRIGGRRQRRDFAPHRRQFCGCGCSVVAGGCAAGSPAAGASAGAGAASCRLADDLHRVFVAQRRHDALELLAQQVVAQLALDLLDLRRLAHALLFELDDVPAELGLHRRLGDGAGLQGESGRFEGRHHLAAAEEAEVAAVLAARVLRLLGELLEGGAALQVGDDLLGRLLGVHQDVAGMQLLLRLELGKDQRLVALRQVLGRQGVDDGLLDIGVAQRLHPQELQLVLEIRPLVEAGVARRLGEQLHVDERVDQHAALLGFRNLAELGAEFVAGDRHLCFGHGLIADARHDCGGIRGRSGRRRRRGLGRRGLRGVLGTHRECADRDQQRSRADGRSGLDLQGHLNSFLGAIGGRARACASVDRAWPRSYLSPVPQSTAGPRSWTAGAASRILTSGNARPS